VLTVGRYPSVKTVKRLVFPQKPSPVMTSFLGESALADCRSFALTGIEILVILLECPGISTIFRARLANFGT
jgi:hypothetical protein